MVLVAQVAHQFVFALRGLQPFLTTGQDLVIHACPALRSQHPIDRGLNEVEHDGGLAPLPQGGNFLGCPLDVVIHILVQRHFRAVLGLPFEFIAIGRQQAAMQAHGVGFIEGMDAAVLVQADMAAGLRFRPVGLEQHFAGRLIAAPLFGQYLPAAEINLEHCWPPPRFPEPFCRIPSR